MQGLFFLKIWYIFKIKSSTFQISSYLVSLFISQRETKSRSGNIILPACNSISMKTYRISHKQKFPKKKLFYLKNIFLYIAPPTCTSYQYSVVWEKNKIFFYKSSYQRYSLKSWDENWKKWMERKFYFFLLKKVRLFCATPESLRVTLKQIKSRWKCATLHFDEVYYRFSSFFIFTTG